jgi:hypothetical protein
MADRSARVGDVLMAGFSGLRAALASCWAALAAAVVLTLAADLLPAVAGLFAVLVAVVVAQGALFRHVFGGASGFNGLRWGRDEWRLLGAHLMVLGLFLLIGSILLVVVGSIALGVARVSAPQLDSGSTEAWREAFASAGPAGWVAGLAPLAALAILVWLGLRLSFTAPATVAEAGVRVLSAFPLTKGKVPVLFVAAGAFAAPVVVAAMLGVSPSSRVGAAVLAGLTYLFLAPAWSGALAHLYRQSAVTQDA